MIFVVLQVIVLHMKTREVEMCLYMQTMMYKHGKKTPVAKEITSEFEILGSFPPEKYAHMGVTQPQRWLGQRQREKDRVKERETDTDRQRGSALASLRWTFCIKTNDKILLSIFLYYYRNMQCGRLYCCL